MKRFMWISAAALAVAVPLGAQVFTGPTTSASPVSEYIVQPNDTLYDLASLKLRDPEKWRWLVQQNRILQAPGRQFTSAGGTFVVVIRPGERLFGLEEVGVNIASPTPVATSSVTSSIEVREKPKTGLADFVKDNWWWLALLGLGALLLWLLGRELRKDPVESRAPQVPGGIDTVEAARERFAQQGYRQHFTIIDTVPGYISGTMMVRYGDGTVRPRTLDRQRAYQSTVRFEDGRTESRYMLQACGNDLKYGGIERYAPGPRFNFTPDPVVVSTPEPMVETPPVQEEATFELTDVAPVTETVDRRELKLEFKPAEKPGDTAMVRVTGASTKDLVLTIGEDDFTLRFHPPTE
jgi:hypothetical protein